MRNGRPRIVVARDTARVAQTNPFAVSTTAATTTTAAATTTTVLTTPTAPTAVTAAPSRRANSAAIVPPHIDRLSSSSSSSSSTHSASPAARALFAQSSNASIGAEQTPAPPALCAPDAGRDAANGTEACVPSVAQVGAARAGVDTFFQSAQGFYALPDWQYGDEEIPRADGQYWEDAQTRETRLQRDPQFYGPDWISEEVQRRVSVQRDLLHQFATTVAAMTGNGNNESALWEGATGSSAMVDSMLRNIAGAFIAPTGLTPVQARSVVPGTVSPSGRDVPTMFSAVNDALQAQQRRELEDTLRQGELQSRQSIQQPRTQRAIEQVVREAQAREAQPGPRGSLGIEPAPARATDGEERVRAPSARVATFHEPVRHMTNMPDVDSAQRVRAPPPLLLSSSSSAAAAASAGQPLPGRRAYATLEEGRGTERPNVRVPSESEGFVYGVDDKWVMAFRKLLESSGDMAMRWWRLIYEDSQKTPEMQRLSDPKLREQYFEQTLRMINLLRRGQGGAQWAMAPEHVGLIFFRPTLTAGIEMAMADVRDVARKSHVPEIDLMTHERARLRFAQLVALHIQKTQRSGISRIYAGSGSGRVADEMKIRHRNLIAVFRRLVYMDDGFLGFAGISNPAGDAERHRLEALRANTLAQRHRYYSDAYPPSQTTPAPVPGLKRLDALPSNRNGAKRAMLLARASNDDDDDDN